MRRLGALTTVLTTGLTIAVTTAVLLASAGCGTSRGPTGPAAATTWHGCTAHEVARAGTAVGVVSESGRRDHVRLIRDGEASCPGLVAITAHGVTGAVLHGLDVDVPNTRPIALRGPGQQVVLLVAEKPVRRGGVQLHLFGSDGDRLGEITSDGHPVLPFYATDGGGSPMTATCPDTGGVGLVTARTHEPPGIVLAWDVSRTTYRVEGLHAAAQDTRVLRRAVADPTLRKEMPHLFDRSFFAGCELRSVG
jgi:hypothetical protein